MDVLFIILIVIGIILAIVAVIYASILERKRREALQELAHELGWSFSPMKDRSHDNEYANFEVFRRGHSRAAYNTLIGTMEIKGRAYQAKAGDFKYKVTRHTRNGRRTSTYRFSYLIVDMPFADVPPLIIRRENLFDRVKGFFGYGSIDFESSEFNRHFYVNSDDKKFAYDVIHPRMMEFLLATKPPTIDMEYGRLCLTDGRRRWKPETFKQQIVWVQQFFDHWPKHVQADLESTAV